MIGFGIHSRNSIFSHTVEEKTRRVIKLYGAMSIYHSVTLLIESGDVAHGVLLADVYQYRYAIVDDTAAAVDRFCR